MAEVAVVQFCALRYIFWVWWCRRQHLGLSILGPGFDSRLNLFFYQGLAPGGGAGSNSQCWWFDSTLSSLVLAGILLAVKGARFLRTCPSDSTISERLCSVDQSLDLIRRNMCPLDIGAGDRYDKGRYFVSVFLVTRCHRFDSVTRLFFLFHPLH